MFSLTFHGVNFQQQKKKKIFWETVTPHHVSGQHWKRFEKGYMYCKQTGFAKRHKVGEMKDKVCVDEKELYCSMQRVIA